MNSLAQRQQGFQRQVLLGPSQPIALEGITGPLHIYIHAYEARMRQALMANFPVLHRAMGDDEFSALARVYCAARPSQHRSIRWLGDSLVEFLSASPALLPHPALLDLARMDWAMRGAFDAADSNCLQLQDLAALAPGDWPTLSLQAVPSLQLLELQWSVEELWHALHADAQAQTREPEPQPHAMLVWRQQLECRWRSIDASEHLALRMVLGKACFAALCEALQEAGDAAPEQRAVALLMAWVSEGLLARG